MKLCEVHNSRFVDAKRDEGNSPVKTRKRSDVRYNIYSEDEALKHGNSHKLPAQTIETIKNKLKAEENGVVLSGTNINNHGNSSKNETHRNNKDTTEMMTMLHKE